MNNKYQKTKVLTGKIRVHHKQFGFIENENIYIKPDDIKDALNKDIVEYVLLKNNFFNYQGEYKEEKKRGKILKVIKRYKENFVVEVIANHNNIIAKFDDKKIQEMITIDCDFKPKLGYKLLIKIHNFDKKNLKGTFIKNLGHKNDSGVDISSIINDLNLNIDFSEKSTIEIDKIDSLIEKFKNNKKFVNLTDKNFFTIDPETAKDFDDAIAVETTNNDDYCLYVAIADVWSYLKECPNIEKEAYERGCSVYLLNSVIPMLPFKLSDNLCSLNENEERNTIIVKFLIDKNGKIMWDKIDIFPAIIKSKKRFNYDEVNEYFEKKNSFPSVSIEIKNSLNIAYKLYKLLNENRFKNGFLNINKDCYKFSLNDNNEITKIYLYKSGDSQKLIEVFMVLANSAVAKFFKSRKLKTIFRYHEQPKHEKIRNFVSMSKDLNFIVPNYNIQNLDLKNINSWFEQNHNNKNLNIVKILLLQSMQKAIYSTSDSDHFGLNLQDYLHFTSPIRRLPDLIVHKLLWMNIFDVDVYSPKEINDFSQKLNELSIKSNESELRSSEAEYLVNKVKIYQYLTKDNKEVFEGVVVGKHKNGMMVKISDFYDTFIETKIDFKLGTNILIKAIGHNQEFKYLKII